MLDRIHRKPEGMNPWPELVDAVLPKVLVCNTAEEMQKQRDYRTECALQLAAATPWQKIYLINSLRAKLLWPIRN